jgi:YggT family protein
MNPFVALIITVIDAYFFVVIASVVMSWLVAFDVVNMRNKFAAMIAQALFRLTEPVYQPIRRFMPNLGGIDISPVVIILGLQFLRNAIIYYVG